MEKNWLLAKSVVIFICMFPVPVSYIMLCLCCSTCWGFILWTLCWWRHQWSSQS